MAAVNKGCGGADRAASSSSSTDPGSSPTDTPATQRASDAQQRAPLTIVCISDTHGSHNKVALPPGDVLVHAGDFTRFGKREDAIAFNEWLGRQPYTHKLVVNGNHEANAMWKREVRQLLFNATVLIDESCSVEGWKFYGTQFYWPTNGDNPNYQRIAPATDVVVAHGPCRGFVDGGLGCSSLANHLTNRVRPLLVISGHIHQAHGVARGSMLSHDGGPAECVYINAAACKNGYSIGWDAIAVMLSDDRHGSVMCAIHPEQPLDGMTTARQQVAAAGSS